MRPPIRILHLEDNPNDAELVKAAIESDDVRCEITWVESKKAYIFALEKGPFDVIVSDYKLPSFDGTSALKMAKEKYPDVPLIFVSGTIGEELAIESLKNGATDYVIKDRLPRLKLSILRALQEVETKTAKMRADQELRQRNNELQKALSDLHKTQQQVIQQERLRALGEMASGIAHDFNNTLTPILGYSEICLSDPKLLDDKAKAIEYLRLMNMAAKDASKVVSRLREFYRPRSKKETFAPTDINRLIQQAVSLTQPKWKDQALARGGTISIETALKEGLPFITGNESELREVLTNLIFNAVDAMPHGGTITLATRLENDSVILQISDTGTGMTEEVRRRCLEPFFTTKGDKGTGLGLSMMYGIIQRHEGTLEIETELGKGTSFLIHLAIHKGKKAIQGIQSRQQPMRSLHILYVEDQTHVRDVIMKYLTGDGHTVEIASNGREGLQKFYGGRFDLIITDRAMPEMNGDQLALAIHKIAPNKPIILLSGTGDLMKAAGQNFQGVALALGKPVTVDHLRQAIAKAMSEPKPGQSG